MELRVAHRSGQRCYGQQIVTCVLKKPEVYVTGLTGVLLPAGDGAWAGRSRLARYVALGLVGLGLPWAVSAQVSSKQAGAGEAGATVSWAPSPVTVSRNARRAVINLRGSIREGWHVYALKQSPTGPTPLIVSVEKNDVALADGSPAGNRPTVAYDPAFRSVTPYYIGTINLTVSVRLRAGLTPGRQLVPINVRYQSCDGRTCAPPKTVRLSAPVDIRAES